MLRPAHLVVALAAALVAGVCRGQTADALPPATTAPAEPGSTPTHFTREEFATALLVESNRVRQLHGRRPLKARAQLGAAADDQAAFMVLLLTVQHTSPIKGQGTPAERVQRHGVETEGTLLAENVASVPLSHEAEPPSAAEIAAILVEQWMNSPGHRANLLNRNFTEFGGAVRVAYVFGRTWYAFGAQLFYRPRDPFARNG